jgi:hypothetical protein
VTTETIAPPHQGDHHAEDVASPTHNRWALALVGMVLALFLIHGWSTIGARFGDSHDGRNAGTWATGSQSLREEGPVESRLGATSSLRGTYANHPPLIYVETALAEAIGGSARAATRAPAWLGSLAVIVLLTMLLREAGLRMISSAMAVATVVATPMFLIYGTMLDTPITSLPFGVALLIVWQRIRQGRHVRPIVAALLAGLAPLAGWQGLLVAAVVAAWALIRLRQGKGDRAALSAMAGGALVGFTLLVAWMLWAFGGSFRGLIEQFRFRTGQSTLTVGWTMLVESEWTDLVAMFGLTIALLAGLGLCVALGDRRTRALTLVAMAVTLPYPLVFKVGAVVHDYWDYWFLLPLALGIGVGCDRLLTRLSHRPVLERAFPVVVAALALVGVLGVSLRPPPAKQAFSRGLGAADAVAGANLALDQPTLWIAGGAGSPPAWAALATGRPAVDLNEAALARVAVQHPDDLVLVGRLQCSVGPHQSTYDNIYDITYAIETAAEAAARPPTAKECPPS